MTAKEFTISISGKSFEVQLLERNGQAVKFCVNGLEYQASIEPKIKKPKVVKPITSVAPIKITTTKTQSAPVLTTSTVVNRKVSSPSPHVSPTTGNEIIAPLPGILAKMLVRAGDEVTPGQPVAIIEAMKMENVITAIRSAVISEVYIREGEEVRKGTALLALSN